MTSADTNRRGPIVLVGGGKMGAALLAGWLAEGVAASDVIVVEPHAETALALAGRHKVKVVTETPASFDRPPTLVLFAVKPQSLDAVAPLYKAFASPGTCFLSIAAGKTLGYFARTPPSSAPCPTRRPPSGAA
jgi:pyrroline-5-carboxylate reductase